jgi:DNA-binding response OmpR family regulator
MTVLVAEDHKRLAEAVAAGLRDEGMAAAASSRRC